MYVRLAFAVAAHLEPEILIVDEVLAVGDAAFQTKCLGKMQDVAKGGRTVLFVSHNMRAVALLCTRAIMLKEGHIFTQGQPEHAINAYLHEVAKDLDRAPVHDFPPEAGRPAQITQLRVLNPQGRPGTEHSLVDPITVEFDYIVSKPFDNLVCMLHVRSMHDELLLASAETDWHNHQSPAQKNVLPKPPGRYSASVTIDAPLLNAGRYELVPLLVHPRVAHVDSRRGMFVDVIDYNSFASTLFNKGRGGILAVPLRWGDETGVEAPDPVTAAPLERRVPTPPPASPTLSRGLHG
jgi:lipopolysaccharide transport system ATP-binding protein